MVWQVAHAVRLPLVGIGGIMRGEDAVEFLLAGATAVQVGTANFVNPAATLDIIAGIEAYLTRHGIGDVNEIVGKLQVG
jgi:dihydroorotate dehydrogenase (NAD+) catalytic subunit